MKKKELLQKLELKFTRNDKKNNVRMDFMTQDNKFFCVIQSIDGFFYQTDLPAPDFPLHFTCLYDDFMKVLNKTKAKNSVQWLATGDSVSIEERDKEDKVVAVHTLRTVSYTAWQPRKSILQPKVVEMTERCKMSDSERVALQSFAGLTLPSMAYETLADTHLFEISNTLTFATTQGISVLGVEVPMMRERISLENKEFAFSNEYLANLSHFDESFIRVHKDVDGNQSEFFLEVMNADGTTYMQFPMHEETTLRFADTPFFSDKMTVNERMNTRETIEWTWDIVNHIKRIDKENQIEKKKLEEMVEADSISLPKGAKAYLSLLKRFWCVFELDWDELEVALCTQNRHLALDIKLSPSNLSTLPTGNSIRFPYQDFRVMVEGTDEEDVWRACAMQDALLVACGNHRFVNCSPPIEAGACRSSVD